MDKITYLKYLSDMSRSELEDYLEAIWKEEIEINEAQEKWLQEHLEGLRVNKAEVYVKVFILLMALLAAVAAYQGAIRRIAEKLPEPKREDYPWDLVWDTEEDEKVCPDCAALHGKVFGKDFFTRPKLHPGCRCGLLRKNRGTRAMNTIRTLEAGAVRAIEDNGVRRLEVLAAPFGSPMRKDKLGQFLSANTDFMIGVGDRRPLLYLHGHTPQARAMKQPKTIGSATTTRIDKKGLWMVSELDNSELSDRTWEAAKKGAARASTGSLNYLARHDKVTGEVLCWPIAELSVWDAGDKRVPVSDDAIVLPLRALFDEQGIHLPDDFEAGEDKRAVVDPRQTIEKDNEMEKKEFEALYEQKKAEERAEQDKMEAMRAEIRKEEVEKLKDHKYRATFNINNIDDKEARKNAEDEEEFAFFRALIEDARTVADGGMPRAYRAAGSLEETEADELGDLVPDQLMDKIFHLLQEYSVVDYLASIGKMTIYKASRLTISAPQNVTAMTALADIAEEGAYVQQVPTFDAKQATMQKVGNYVTVTEEGLDDQTLFQSWFPVECARAVALSKNADLYALTNAVAGTDLATRSTFTDAEILACYYGLPQQYRQKAVWLMKDESLADIRALLVATPRAYGDIGFMPWGGMGEQGESFMGKPIICNDNWEDVTGADAADKVVDFLNMDEAIFWAERQALRIFVDPYSTRLSAGTINFLPMARYGGVVKNSAAMSGIDGKDA